MELSQWHEKGVKPVHIGVYEVQDDIDAYGITWYAYWDGEKFGYRSFPPDDALLRKDWDTGCPQLTKWRGIVKK